MKRNAIQSINPRNDRFHIEIKHPVRVHGVKPDNSSRLAKSKWRRGKVMPSVIIGASYCFDRESWHFQQQYHQSSATKFIDQDSRLTREFELVVNLSIQPFIVTIAQRHCLCNFSSRGILCLRNSKLHRWKYPESSIHRRLSHSLTCSLGPTCTWHLHIITNNETNKSSLQFVGRLFSKCI